MAEKINNSDSDYLPPNFPLMVSEWKNGADSGTSSGIEAMDRHFKWKRGFINGWYGWPNDGKGTFFDYMSTVSAKLYGDKFGMFKREDLGSFRTQAGEVVVNANDIYNNLIWTFTGKTPYRHIAEKYRLELLDIKEYTKAEEWVREHFYVYNFKDRRHQAILDKFATECDKRRLNHVLIDPWKSCIIREGKGRTKDEVLHMEFDDSKKLAEEKHISVNYIAHPKSMNDVRVSKKADSAFKVISQYDVAGGAAFDNSMDGQFSIYRPERHLNVSDPKVEFHNLKQRKAELLGVFKGVVKEIEFDWMTKGYFFNGINPLTGKQKIRIWEKPKEQGQSSIFDTPKDKGPAVNEPNSDLPF
jgi:hypothetical protein